VGLKFFVRKLGKPIRCVVIKRCKFRSPNLYLRPIDHRWDEWLFNGELMIEEIAANLYKIEIPLPEIPLKSINSYVIKASRRNLIIDTGMNLEECMNVMQMSLKNLKVDLGNTDFFITHFHGDHFGLVPRLIKDESIIYINKLEADVIDKIRSGVATLEIESFARKSGFPEKDIGDIFPPRFRYELKESASIPLRFVDDENVLEIGDYRLKCVKTPGHSRGHICLYESSKKILFSGDHLLSDITPGIQARLDNENPLREYLLSLDKVYQLDVELVLPGHRGIFRDCKKRIKELQDHHQERSDEVLAILKEGSKNVYQVASRMTWSIIDCDTWDDSPSMQKFFATGEAAAHLKYLEDKGCVRKETKGQQIVYSLNVNPKY
jgi:glyoxylase-like metal-dependent hydrolase (beta-lactamase superfamily II)